MSNFSHRFFSQGCNLCLISNHSEAVSCMLPGCCFCLPCLFVCFCFFFPCNFFFFIFLACFSQTAKAQPGKLTAERQRTLSAVCIFRGRVRRADNTGYRGMFPLAEWHGTTHTERCLFLWETWASKSHFNASKYALCMTKP